MIIIWSAGTGGCSESWKFSIGEIIKLSEWNGRSSWALNMAWHMTKKSNANWTVNHKKAHDESAKTKKEPQHLVLENMNVHNSSTIKTCRHWNCAGDEKNVLWTWVTRPFKMWCTRVLTIEVEFLLVVIKHRIERRKEATWTSSWSNRSNREVLRCGGVYTHSTPDPTGLLPPNLAKSSSMHFVLGSATGTGES